MGESAERDAERAAKVGFLCVYVCVCVCVGGETKSDGWLSRDMHKPAIPLFAPLLRLRDRPNAFVCPPRKYGMITF